MRWLSELHKAKIFPYEGVSKTEDGMLVLSFLKYINGSQFLGVKFYMKSRVLCVDKYA